MITFTIMFLSLLLSHVRETGAEIGTTAVLIMRDPFQQPVPVTYPVNTVEKVEKAATIIIDEARKLELKAVMMNGEKSMVNINGKILAVGDEIDNYRLMDIQADRAFLQKNNIKVEVSLDK